MTLILSHIGNSLPTHINVCIEQTRKFYNGDIFLITNCKNEKIKNKYGVQFISPDFTNKKYLKSKKINFHSFPNKEFWLYSLARFFFIEDFVTQNKIENFVIYENDILIYYDLKKLINTLSSLYQNIAFTIGDDIRATTGFSFFKSYNDLSVMNHDIITIIEDTDKMEDIRKNYSECCPSEMVFIRKISKEKDYIKSLPIFPNEKYFNELGFVFDPASYGQFLGGTPAVNGNKKTFIDDITYIGKKLLSGEYNVIFHEKKCPFLIDKNGNKSKIYNLHIHSKKLENFITQ